MNLTYNPFIPLPIMAVICVVLIVLKRKGVWNFIRQIIVVLLLFGMNMRILVPSDNVIVTERPIDILFVVDNTISMNAEDYDDNKPRLDGVKTHINDIIEAFPGARYSLITFANRAECIVPYTTEVSQILNNVNNLNGLIAVSADGTSLNIAIPPMESNLERNYTVSDDEDEQLANRDIPQRIQIVFFISDGEITNNERLASFSDLAEYIDTGAVLGYGTRDGAPMRVRQYADSNPEYLTYYDRNFNRVRATSSIDERNLQHIADDLEVPYYRIHRPRDIKEVISNIQAQIDEGEFVTADERKKGYNETYQWFGLGLILFIGADYVITRLKMKGER